MGWDGMGWNGMGWDGTAHIIRIGAGKCMKDGIHKKAGMGEGHCQGGKSE